MHSTGWPTRGPTGWPTGWPTQGPTGWPTRGPTGWPTGWPTQGPTGWPTGWPTQGPTQGPTGWPTRGRAFDPMVLIRDQARAAMASTSLRDGNRPCLFLREHQIVAEGDLEDPARALDQLDFRALDPGEPVSHTESFRFVPSGPAVFNPELHSSRSPTSPGIRARAYIGRHLPGYRVREGYLASRH